MPKKHGHFLQFVTLRVLIRSALNLAQINVISVLTKIRNLLETTLENEVAPSSEVH